MQVRLLFVISLLISIFGTTYSYPGNYIQLQGGIGGMDTKHYSANSDPYNKIYLHQGMAYRFSLGSLLGSNTVNFGTEIGYARYPLNKYEFSSSLPESSGVQKYTGSNIDLLGVLKYSLSGVMMSDFYLIVKAGVARVTQKFNSEATILGNSFVINKTVNQYKPESIIGVGYNFSKAVSIDLSYDHIFAGQADPAADSVADQNSLTKISSVNTLMAGIVFYYS